MGIDVDLNIEVDRQLPDAESDSTSKPMRGGRYGEGYVLNIVPTTHLLADEGTYQIVTNATPGTAIAGVVNASVSETAGNLLYIKNDDSNGNDRAKRVYVHYIRLIMSVIPSAGISAHFFIKTDKSDRYVSGGTQLFPTNVNQDTGTGTVSKVFFGALTTIAPTPSARVMGRAVMRSVIPVANDEYLFTFGTDNLDSGTSLGGIVAQRMVIPCAPLVLGPQNNACLQVWFPSNAVTPAQYEIEIGMWER